MSKRQIIIRDFLFNLSMNEPMNVEEDIQMQESLALLRMLVDSSADAKAGNVRDSDEIFTEIRQMIAEKREKSA